jgi:para-aminobenzoate synthetase component 1
MTEPVFPLVERLPAGFASIDAFRRLAGREGTIFLDSSQRHETLGRYSFLACDPYASKTVAAGEDGSEVLAQCRAELQRIATPPHPDLPPFQGGLAGLFGYELAHSFETLPRPVFDEFEVPALAVGFYDLVICFDHRLSQAWLLSQGFPEMEPRARAERARSRLAELKAALKRTPPPEELPSRPPCPLQAPSFSLPGHDRLVSNVSKEAYLAKVAQTIEYIRAGDIFQANLSQRLLHPASLPASEFYAKLRAGTASTFGGYLNAGEFQVMSVSPERFLQIRNRLVEARPIKGTRPIGAIPMANMHSARVLSTSEKDRAENVMIVDLLRNDISRACKPESVRVPVLCGLESYGYVQHLVSVVQGELKEDCTAFDLLEHAFPGGSITGAPKIRAMEIITELEQVPRGAYCGSMGYISAGGDMDLNILIRTVTAKHGWWQMPVGGGIVADSQPAEEYAETWAKAAGMLRGL